MCVYIYIYTHIYIYISTYIIYTYGIPRGPVLGEELEPAQRLRDHPDDVDLDLRIRVSFYLSLTLYKKQNIYT